MEERDRERKEGEAGWGVVDGLEVFGRGHSREGRITYSASVFGTQLIKQRRGEMQKG